MLVGVTNDGKPDNGKFFRGRLPKIGEAVQMVYVGQENDTYYMRFQLRTVSDQELHSKND